MRDMGKIANLWESGNGKIGVFAHFLRVEVIFRPKMASGKHIPAVAIKWKKIKK